MPEKKYNSFYLYLDLWRVALWRVQPPAHIAKYQLHLKGGVGPIGKETTAQKTDQTDNAGAVPLFFFKTM